jgi:two-component system, chemotaxis family, sensor histidine kinase and response regulator WspE
LGKVKNITAAALLPDGSPLLIVDVDDLMREIDNFLSGNRLSSVGPASGAVVAKERKRVLVVDDSLTVRELERKLLDGNGYAVDIAVDGMDGWNAVRTGHYDLVVTDIDMPRLDGIELVTLIRKDTRLKALPIMIVSYKDRPEDRQRGLEAGADYYLTKGSFHDETLIRAVADLIGEIPR